MKLLYTLIFSVCILGSAYSQDKTQTLFGDEMSYGGFGGPLVVFSQINGTVVGDVGGGGGFSINSFFIGGYGLGNDGAQVDHMGQSYDIHFRHGGFWLGYALHQHKMIHLYTSLRIGWGESELKLNDEKAYGDNMFVLSPELGVELNITNWFKLDITGGYRSVHGITNLAELSNSDFSSMYGALTFRFGGFGDYHSYKKELDWD